MSQVYAAKFGIERTDVWFLLKLQEELGELTQAFVNLKGMGKDRGQSDADKRADDPDTPVALAPTLRAANEAASSIGAQASSVHKLVHEHGFCWDDDGRWSRLAVGDVDPPIGAIYYGPAEAFAVNADTRLVIDEDDEREAVAADELVDLCRQPAPRTADRVIRRFRARIPVIRSCRL